MEWVKKEDNYRVPIKSWCNTVEKPAMAQAVNLADHPMVFHHVALMPDCHPGYGMPIGGVIACIDTVIPNAVGVDIGCGMGAVKTSISSSKIQIDKIRTVTEQIKKLVPHGEGRAHQSNQDWKDFEYNIDSFKKRGWFNGHVKQLANRNLGTLGGGNHFIEIQKGDDGFVWLMIHSGSRHLGNVIAKYYNSLALDLNTKWKSAIPNKDLAFLPASSEEGKLYIKDMTLALAYAKENRKRIMQSFKTAIKKVFKRAEFEQEINIHHNYTAIEHHFNKNVWVHRKGATSAKKDELGIIPGSMGTSSYIVKGLGNKESFMSCSHGAGRVMGRSQASRTLTMENCDNAMKGIVYDRWSKVRRGRGKGKYDFSEAPQAYKDINKVIESELDLIEPVVKLKPVGVVKG